MIIPILYEDESLLVIDKPAGVTVNRADTVGEKTVQDWAEKNIKYQISNIKNTYEKSNIFQDFKNRAGIVHRLDKETSGCLIIAKTETAFIELQRQFKQREIKKEYLALVHGRVEPKQGTIRVPLARSRFDRQKFAVSAAGRPAETCYEVIRTLQGLSLRESPQGRVLEKLEKQFTLVGLFPATGRTHQIRVHLKYFGHPIVSDEKYGGKRAVEDRKWCPRLFLHAAKITFNHPVSGNPVLIEASLPGDLAIVIKQLAI